MINEKWFGKDVMQKNHSLTEGSIHTFGWRDWDKPRDASDSIAVLRAEIWIRDLSNTKHENIVFVK
jgi:hypothetical protein